jgi:hypothetical protein
VLSRAIYKKQRGRRWLTALATLSLVTGAFVVASTAQAATGPIGTAAGFEDNDGNLVVDTLPTDWNSFTGATWTGTAPYQSTSKTVNGWAFTGLTDASKSNTDTGFAGGVKQDDNCAKVNGGSAPNKDDLKRIYVATKSVSGFAAPNPTHVFLELGWVRIPQNTTSASAHVGFEFNQGITACAAGSDGLVQRTLGDLLFVYDFEGSSTSNPTLTVRTWVANGTPCDVSSDTGHGDCWGVARNLSAAGFAEAAVDTGGNGTPSTALDTVAPVTETLGTNEFGEAGADLTAAGIFTSSSCLTLGQVEGVSRSSGNSGSAAMEDLVGPGIINVSNCATVNIIKHTDPRGVNQAFSYTSNLTGAQLTCTLDTTPASFTLNDSGNTTADNTANTEHCTNVPTGSYTVTEGADPAGFTFTSLSCTATTGSSGAQDGTAPRQANISVIGGGVVTCTYVNTRQLGAIKITKTAKNKNLGSGDQPQSGVVFSVSGHTGTVSTGTDGTACVDGLAFGNHTVTETVPTGYQADSTNPQTIDVETSTTCGSGSETPATFHNTPLTTITVSTTSLAGDGVTTSTVKCAAETTAVATPHTTDGLVPGEYTCTVVIDP